MFAPLFRAAAPPDEAAGRHVLETEFTGQEDDAGQEVRRKKHPNRANSTAFYVDGKTGGEHIDSVEAKLATRRRKREARKAARWGHPHLL